LLKACNSYSIDGIAALRCLNKLEEQDVAPLGPEIPARSSGVTTGPGEPSASTVRPPMRHS
jgi:hypothetical protein